MFKNILQLEAIGREERKYFLQFNPQAPLGEIVEVLDAMKSRINTLIEEYEKKEKEDSKEGINV